MALTFISTLNMNAQLEQFHMGEAKLRVIFKLIGPLFVFYYRYRASNPIIASANACPI